MTAKGLRIRNIGNETTISLSAPDNSAENLHSGDSRIRDADMALETVIYTKNMILSQSGTAMLAQANQKDQTVLQLLQ
jgi:flagellin